MHNNKQPNIRKYKIVFPIAGIVIGILLIILFFSAGLSGIMFVIALVMLVLSAIFLKKWWGSIGEDESRVIVTDKTTYKSAECMNIYPDKVIFENMTKPEGQPWKCENNGKSYFIHIWNEENKRLTEFNLPDQAYMDPQLLATRVLELPAHRRIFRRKQTLLQQLSPMMAALGVIIMWIVIITTT